MNSSEYDIPVFKTKIDTCRIAKGIQSSFFIKTILENFDKSSDFKIVCPYKKVNAMPTKVALII